MTASRPVIQAKVLSLSLSLSLSLGDRLLFIDLLTVLYMGQETEFLSPRKPNFQAYTSL